MSIQIKKTGSFSKLGYKSSNKMSERQTSLRKAVKLYGYNYTMKKLNAICTLNKNREAGKNICKDKTWLKKNFGNGSKSSGSRKKSAKKSKSARKKKSGRRKKSGSRRK